MKIGEKIKVARESKGWSVDELAYNSKVSRETIYNIEIRNHSNVGLLTLGKISQALGVTIIHLLDDSNSKTGDQHDNTVPQT